MSKTLELAEQLIACLSITPHDAGCQDILIDRLKAMGFHIEKMRFGNVDNFWARYGNAAPLFAFVGHTDVVPTGPIEKWHSPPFVPTIRNGYLYGRGAADMKGNIAAMVIACENILKSKIPLTGSIAFLITSDEEGVGIDGTTKVIEQLEARGEKIDWCLVGEPSSQKTVGDTIKNGRRGSLSGKLTLQGIQGHIAYPHLADNPIHRIAPFMHELLNIVWDKGNEHFDPTQLQISNLHAGTGVDNVIPGDLNLNFNFRYSPEVTQQELINIVESLADKHLNKERGSDLAKLYQIQWHASAKPFLTKPGILVNACRQAIQHVMKHETTLSTSGGTSDGRFVAPTGSQVVELGVINQTIHQINECVEIEALEQLTAIYEQIIKILMGTICVT